MYKAQQLQKTFVVTVVKRLRGCAGALGALLRSVMLLQQLHVAGNLGP